MKQLQFAFSDESALTAELKKIRQQYESGRFSALLFHVFTGVLDNDRIERVLGLIRQELPGACVAGCSTNGNIVDGDYSDAAFAVSCAMFEYPTSRVEALQYPLTVETQVEIAELIVRETEKRSWVKGVELLATIRGMSMTGLCDALSEAHPDVQIFGGGALSNNLDTNAACVFCSAGDRPKRGIVAVFWGGENLHLNTSYLTGWKPLGSYLTVTAAEGRILKELNHRPAYETYQKYLHINNDENFFSNTREFPFFYRYHGIDLLRAPTASHPDGSLTMTSEMAVNVKARLAYGDPWTIVESAWQEGKRLLAFAPEGIMIFSCAGRRTFWGNAEVGRETEPYQQVAPTFGFYTSGEFLRTGKYVNQHNVTQVICALREGEARPRPENESFLARHGGAGKVSLINRLATFIKVTTEELEEAYRRLSELAVVDTLTGVGSKNAYLEKIKQMDEMISAGKADFAVAVFDLNGLKAINDNHGHECGDMLLSDAAKCMIRAFGRENLYRAGGDEFMAILSGASREDMARCFRALDEAIAEENKTPKPYQAPLSLSKGCAVYQPGADREYREVIKRADQAMYADKAAYYMEHGDRRKRH